MSLSYTATADVTVICHGAGRVHVLDLSPGEGITTGQPQMEEFTDPAAAAAWLAAHAPLQLTDSPRVLAHLVPDPDALPLWNETTHYAIGAIVRYSVTGTELTFLKISDAFPSIPDLVFDAKAGTGDWVPCVLPAATGGEPQPEPVEPQQSATHQQLQALEARLAALEGKP